MYKFSGFPDPVLSPEVVHALHFKMICREEAARRGVNLSVSQDVPEAQVRERLSRQLAERCWFLQQYWKGSTPIEQVYISAAEKEAHVYNYGSPLKFAFLRSLINVFQFVAGIAGGKLLDEVRYVLIDSRRYELPGGVPVLVAPAAPDGAIILFPEGLSVGNYTIAQVPVLEALLIREFLRPLIPPEQCVDELLDDALRLLYSVVDLDGGRKEQLRGYGIERSPLRINLSVKQGTGIRLPESPLVVPYYRRICC